MVTNLYLKDGDQSFKDYVRTGSINYILGGQNVGTDKIYDFLLGEDTIDFTDHSDITWEDIKDNIQYLGDSTYSIDLTEYGLGTLRIEIDDSDSDFNPAVIDNIRDAFVFGPATRGDDDLTGTHGDDYMRGHHGDDKLYGRSGDDKMLGDQGDDYMHGAGGDDEMHGGSGNDTMYGGTNDDVMYGDAGNDTMDGGGGDDVMHGGADHDTMYGGGGDDEMHGDSGFDTMRGAIGNDTMYGGAGEDKMYGDAGNDTMDGGDDNDLIYGNSGNNTIIGGRGNDSLVSGTGNDIFVFGPDSGGDTVYYFNRAENTNDRIDLSGYTDISDISDLTITQTTTHSGLTATVIKIDDKNAIWLYDYEMDDLDASNFIFNGDQDAYYGG